MIRTRLIHWITNALSAAVVLISAPVFAQDLVSEDAAIVDASVITVAGHVQSGESTLEVETIQEGSSSRGVRAEATQALPLQQLPEEHLVEVQKILDNTSLYRRLPQIRVDADRRVYEYFTRNPDVAISIWRVMQISEVEMLRIRPGVYDADTKDGSMGRVHVLHQSEKSTLILCDGQFRSPATRRSIRASALMHLQPRFETNEAGESRVTHTLDLFVSFPSQTFETLARIVSPVSNRIADRNFEEVSLFIEMMDLAMSRQPGWVERVSQQLNGVEPDAPNSLLQVTAEVYVDAQRRLSLQHGVTPSVYQITAPDASVKRVSASESVPPPRR